jgi:hypothetical protein
MDKVSIMIGGLPDLLSQGHELQFVFVVSALACYPQMTTRLSQTVTRL